MITLFFSRRFLFLYKGMNQMDIYIVTGFSGSGKTTFLNQYVPLLSRKTAIIQNESGEVLLDPALQKTTDMISRLPAGCVCCTLAADLRTTIRNLYEEYHMEQVFIEPSGVGRLSDVTKICRDVHRQAHCDIRAIRKITLVDISMLEEYLEDFGDFYRDQIIYADTILLSCLEEVPDSSKEDRIRLLHGLNPGAVLYEQDWRALSGGEFLELIAQNETGCHGTEPEEERIIMNPSEQGIRKKKEEQDGRNKRFSLHI